MDSRVLRADPRPGRDGRRRGQVHAREPGRRGRHARGHAALRRAARGGRADHLLHRARHAGRPVDRRHQAGHPGDRRRDRRSRCSSPPARRSRSTPATAATSAGSPGLSPTADAARSKARKRALDVLFESEQRGVDPLETLAGRVAAADPPVNEFTVELVEGVVAHRDRIDELLDDLLPGLVAGPDARRRPRGAAAGRPSSCSGSTTSRTRWSSTRRSSWPAACRPTSRPASSTACSAGCSTSSRCWHRRPDRIVVAKWHDVADAARDVDDRRPPRAPVMGHVGPHPRGRELGDHHRRSRAGDAMQRVADVTRSGRLWLTGLEAQQL